MKVILDANIIISYLLDPHTPRVVTGIVEACLSHKQFELVAPAELIDEITEKVAEKPYLRTHISAQDLHDLLDIISSVTTISPPLNTV